MPITIADTLCLTKPANIHYDLPIANMHEQKYRRHAHDPLDTLFAFYACDRDDAERQASALLSEHPMYERIDLKAFPGGFVIHHARLPGVMEEER